MPSRSWSTISSSRSRDLLVHAAEVVPVELLAALLAQLLEHLAHALDVAALAVLEPLLHHAAQRGVEVAVVEEIVGHLLEQRVGVEVEADLRAVPPRVLEPAHRRSRRYPYASDAVGFPTDFWWGTGASSTQAEGAAPASRLDARRAARAGCRRRGDGNGFGDALRRGLRAVRAVRADAPPPVDRVGAHRARGRPARRRRDRALPRGARRPPATPASSPWVCLHHFTLPGWFTEIGEGGFVDERARSYFWPRHVAFCAETFGDLVFGWKPINEPAAYASIYRTGGRSPRSLDWGKVFDMLGAMLLAQRDAWRELRGGGAAGRDDPQPVADLRVGETVQPTQVAAALEAVTWDVWMRADRDGVLELPGRVPREVPDLREACDLVGFSYYSRARASTRDGKVVPYPPRRARRADGLRAVERRPRASCCAGCTTSCPAGRCSICEHGVGTDDDEWRCDVLRESLADRRRRDRRRRRPARLLPLDRRRQLRVGPRLRRASSAASPATANRRGSAELLRAYASR